MLPYHISCHVCIDRQKRILSLPYTFSSSSGQTYWDRPFPFRFPKRRCRSPQRQAKNDCCRSHCKFDWPLLSQRRSSFIHPRSPSPFRSGVSQNIPESLKFCMTFKRTSSLRFSSDSCRESSLLEATLH